jgi:Predicted integral membrane protein
MDSLSLLVVIAGVAFACFILEEKAKWLAKIGAVCLIIIVAMLLSQLQIVPTQHTLYDFLQGPTVLLSLVLLTIGLNLNEVKKLHWKTLSLFVFGASGSVFGGIMAGIIAAPSLGTDAYKLAAQLTASYIGGGENAVAMQKILEIPQEQFVAVFAVDNIVTSIWMAITIWFASNNKDKSIVGEKGGGFSQFAGDIKVANVIGTIFIGLTVVLLSTLAAKHLGGLHKILWMSLIALSIGQIQSLKEYLKPAYLLGSVLFSGFFFSIGAVSDLSAISALPVALIAMPFIVVGVHAIFIGGAYFMLKTTRSTASVLSQSLIGGPATAVAVSQAIGWKQGVSLGLILGVLGYAIANFIGVAVHSILLNFLK